MSGLDNQNSVLVDGLAELPESLGLYGLLHNQYLFHCRESSPTESFSVKMKEKTVSSASEAWVTFPKERKEKRKILKKKRKE